MTITIPVYEVDLDRKPLGLGWAWTLRRNGHIIGQATGLLALAYRSRSQALQAATVLAQHDHERHRVRLPPMTESTNDVDEWDDWDEEEFRS